MKILNKKAVSVVEYLILFVIIISAFLVMKNYIQFGMYGKWGQTGKSFAFGRQYDPQKTIDCRFDGQSQQWYDYNCFEYNCHLNNCNGDPVCEENVITGGLCAASACNQLKPGGP